MSSGKIEEETNANIKVAVRIRPPLLLDEKKMKEPLVYRGEENTVLLRNPEEATYKNESQLSHRMRSVSGHRSGFRERQYTFDMVFDQGCSQREVFNQTTKHLCQSVLDGYNSTVFTYGATGAGKTHTMIGNALEPGIMYNTLEEIFRLIEENRNRKSLYKVKVSFLEIYNETIRDLIKPSNSNLELREDQEKGIRVTNLSQLRVHTP